MMSKQCPGDKAPGPDVYTKVFYQKHQFFPKENIMKGLEMFHNHHFLDKSFNATNIALISKKNEALELRDFRPKLGWKLLQDCLQIVD